MGKGLVSVEGETDVIAVFLGKSLDQLKAMKVTFREVILHGQALKRQVFCVLFPLGRSGELVFMNSTGRSAKGIILEACGAT